MVMTGYGDAHVIRHDDGRVVVEHADDVIGISFELLAEPGAALTVDSDGLLLLAGDPAYRYRPVRVTENARILVCERVRPPDTPDFPDGPTPS